MLAKDRNPTKPVFRALTDTETLVGQVASTVYNESRIPKRKRTIGERMLNNSISSYEKIRAANKTPLFKDKNTTNKRIELAESAEMDLMNLCSEIKLLPTVINTIEGTESWYTGMQALAISCKNETNKWVGSDMARAEKHYAKLEEKSSEPILKECIRFHPIPYRPKGVA